MKKRPWSQKDSGNYFERRREEEDLTTPKETVAKQMRTYAMRAISVVTSSLNAISLIKPIKSRRRKENFCCGLGESNEIVAPNMKKRRLVNLRFKV